jgi:hypothetical protein
MLDPKRNMASRLTVQPSGPLSVTRYTVGSTSFDMLRVPPGRFLSPAYFQSGPREVLVSRPFEVGVTEVTEELWFAVMGSLSPARSNGPDRPMQMVSWEAAEAFAGLLDVRHGLPGFRLPTDAEWTWASSCGVRTRWSGSSRAPAVVSAVTGVVPVSSLAPSGVDPKGPVINDFRINRGAGWTNSLWTAGEARTGISVTRSVDAKNRINGYTGLRLARTLQ